MADIGDANEVLQQITEFDLLIVDTPPAIEEHPEQIQILVEAADLVLIPSQPSDDDTESVIPWMDFIEHSGKPAAFVLNRIRRNTHSLRAAKLMLLRAGCLCPMEIPHTEDMSRSRSIGVGILEIKNGQGADELNGVWAFVRTELGL